jgi:hypothetical protein
MIATVIAAAAPAVLAQPAPGAGGRVDASAYPWLADLAPLPPLTSLEERFPAPAGSARVAAPDGSFAAWLRSLPVRLDRREVLTHAGRPIAAPAAAVILLDLGRGDLQQCADTILRLHAEYRWARGQAAAAAYHFTSGDLSRYAAWLAGESFAPAGNRVVRRSGPPRVEGHATYRGWLQHLFIYAGTRSLALDSRALAPGEAIAAGDFFVAAGSPGHAVMVLDVAVADGRRFALIGQGYTPAQELHVIEADGTVWLELPGDASGALRTPSWSPFPASSVRRFRDLG